MQPTVIANGHGHGRWRGRGQERGRGRGRAFQSSQDQNQGRPFEEGLGPVPLGRFDNRALRFVGAVGSLPGQTTQAQSSEHSTNDPADVVITQVRALGSYNWTGEQEPNIIVPGSPPIWKNTPFNKTHPLTIRPDVEVFQGSEVFVDHGSGTKQAESLLAMLTAVELCTPDFNWNPSDIVSDRNSLRNLLRWVTWDSSARWRPRNFRIDMHLAGEKTLVLTRWKRDIVQRPAEHSYGFSYERSETVPVPGCALSRAAGHDRIMAYDFGGLSIVARYEVDACLSGDTSIAVDEMTKAFETTNLTPKPKLEVEQLFNKITYSRAGTLVPQEELVELATRTPAVMRTKGLDDLFLQIYFGWTPHLFIALHDSNGRFNEHERYKLGESQGLLTMAERIQPQFRRLRDLLKALQDVAIQFGPGTNLTVLQREGELEVFRREEGAVLPTEFVAKFT